ncbi:MAG: HPr family phosphocarrier protein [Pseudomonadota bacterium]
MTVTQDTSVDGWICGEMEIVNKRGLHARASAKFVQVCEQFDASITVEKDGTKVGGQSIMGLMLLAAAKGSTIRVCARGDDAGPALDAIGRLLVARFGEDD